MAKKHFYYNGKTGIARTEGFKHKLLADYSVNIGNICEFGCSFCYVPSVTSKQRVVIDILEKGYSYDQFSCYRYKNNILETVTKDLIKISPNDRGVVFFCTTCDPCATLEHADTTIEVIKLIMKKSNLNVRVLSKSILIKNIAEALTIHSKRIFYGLSTGTSLDEVSKAIEQNASPIRKRVEVLHWLQDNNFRTYGMICPVIPSEVDSVKELLDQIRPKFCEDVWVEAVNVRGKSLLNTYEKLLGAGLEKHANELQRVMGNKDNWREYSKKLFLNFQYEMRKRNQLKKLHFLQYVSPEDKEFFGKQEGAVCL
jgi:DNA repair photolyase